MDRFNVELNSTDYIDHEILFAAVGYSLNHLLWNTSSTSVWDSLATFIQTGDQNTFQFVYDLLTTNGVKSRNIR